MIGERLDRWLRTHPSLVDFTGAVTLAVLLSVPWLPTDSPWNAATSAGMLLPLAWRRSHPVPVVAVITVASLAAWASMDTLTPAAVAVPAAVYAARAFGPPWLGRIALGLGLLGAVLQAAKNGGDDAVQAVMYGTAMAAVVTTCWAFATLARVRRERVDALQERARLLEVERDQQARLAAAAERARIAREMHDVVAHSLAIVVAQADGGRYAARADPAAADRALSTVADTARGALADMRRLLGVLREGDDAPAGEERAPQPGLDGLPALAERIRSGGVPVRLTVSGEPRPAPDGLGLAAYRIAQEGLTNVLKHAGPGATAELSVRWTGRALEVDVLDDGRGSGADPAAGPGHGLAGMRERAAIFGGGLDAGPRPGGGFAVRAVLPL